MKNLFKILMAVGSLGAPLICVAEDSAPPAEEWKESLPPDVPQVPELIYRREYPLKRKLLVELGGVYLYGDKFLNTYGGALSTRYHWHEKWGVGFDYAMFNSASNSELELLQKHSATPTTHDPVWMASVVLRFIPVYGKVIIGESIGRFNLFLEFGGHAAQEKIFTSIHPGLRNTRKTELGPVAALGLFVPFSHVLSLSTRIGLSGHPRMAKDSGWRRQVFFVLAPGGRFSL